MDVEESQHIRYVKNKHFPKHTQPKNKCPEPLCELKRLETDKKQFHANDSQQLDQRANHKIRFSIIKFGQTAFLPKKI